MPNNMFIFLTHGTKAIVKTLARNIDKALTTTNSQATVALAVIVKEEINTATSEKTFLYYVESIQLRGQTKPTAVSEEGLTLPSFIQYIQELQAQERHNVANSDMLLCCDGNLGKPGAPHVTPELCRLISDGQETPSGINPGQIVLFSSTEACRDDSNTYLSGRPSNLGYRCPTYLITGRVLDSDASSLKEGVTSMMTEPDSFSLNHSRHATIAPSSSEISKASPTHNTEQLPTRWYSIFTCCSNNAAVIPQENKNEPLTGAYI